MKMYYFPDRFHTHESLANLGLAMVSAITPSVKYHHGLSTGTEMYYSEKPIEGYEQYWLSEDSPDADVWKEIDKLLMPISEFRRDPLRNFKRLGTRDNIQVVGYNHKRCATIARYIADILNAPLRDVVKDVNHSVGSFESVGNVLADPLDKMRGVNIWGLPIYGNIVLSTVPSLTEIVGMLTSGGWYEKSTPSLSKNGLIVKDIPLKVKKNELKEILKDILIEAYAPLTEEGD